MKAGLIQPKTIPTKMCFPFSNLPNQGLSHGLPRGHPLELGHPLHLVHHLPRRHPLPLGHLLQCKIYKIIFKNIFCTTVMPVLSPAEKCVSNNKMEERKKNIKRKKKKKMGNK